MANRREGRAEAAFHGGEPFSANIPNNRFSQGEADPRWDLALVAHES